ncbi:MULTISPECIES: glycosyltransferase family 39 protein [Streptacidiphilus]|uniref:ArnT family glycosyltransferase n=1 Tax=Streptacidiphilus cavernicola TaxID=3342716 RepID=A0ABV6UR03_9ACTN|nr:glycosyltransferase family 39 protein [Streptacidiphilus jeojiense]
MATIATSTAVPAPRTEAAPQPRYARPALIVITAVATLLYAWDIGHSSYHPFYADAVRSMAGSWKAFVYGSFDPGNTITLDKLPGFLWPQALSARVFGFHAWALTLPQVIEGVLSVLVLHRAVRRWAGVNAALFAAALFTLTPVVAGLFRTAVEEPAFTLLLLLAADATQRAARDARLRSLLLAGVWVGLAFQAKMLEAFAVLPALALVYGLSAPARLRRRLLHLGLAGAVTLAVSASWMLLVTLTPAQDRPYVDGSTDNSAVSMVVGYNFLNRFSSVGVNAADTGSVQTVRAGGMGGGGAAGAHHGAANAGTGTGTGAGAVAQGAGHGGSGGSGSGGGRGDGGWTKLLTGPMAAQTGWFYPLALATLLLGFLQRRRAPRTDTLRAGLLLWGTWFAVFFLVLSAGSVNGHTYYLGVVAAPLAALGGAGLVLLWRAYRRGGAAAWALPATVAVTAGWGARLTHGYPTFLPLLMPAVLLVGLVSVLLLAVPLALPGLPRFRSLGRLAAAGFAAGLVAMLVAPAAWSSSVLDPAYGHSGMGAVGPPARRMWGFAPKTVDPAMAAFAGVMRGSGTLTTAQRSLLGYTKANRDGARYLFATNNWALASPYILASDAAVLPIGGFTNQAPSPTLASLKQQVSAGELGYVLLSDRPLDFGAGGGGGGGGGAAGGGGSFGAGHGTGRGAGGAGDAVATTVAAQATGWVTSNCTVVPPAAYGGGVAGSKLYHCSPKQS